jgi:SagB-type dehydrogenase family enzyme
MDVEQAMAEAANRDIAATLHYHEGTKHPGGFLLNPWHTFDPAERPPFKMYVDRPAVALAAGDGPGGLPALQAIGHEIAHSDKENTPSLETVSHLLHYSAGITRRIHYPGWGELAFRAAACTGALYHIELYVVCGDLPGLDAGVYHYDPQAEALELLRSGDHRGTLVDASGEEPAVAHAPAVLVYTDVPWRNALKYQAREYRHAFWDSGTMVANTLALATAAGLPARVVAGFADRAVNRLLGLDPAKEMAVSLLPAGYQPSAVAPFAAEIEPLNLTTAPESERKLAFPAIRVIHAASSLDDAAAVRAWRGRPPALDLPPPVGPIVPLAPRPAEDLAADSPAEVIGRRGSTRQFAREPITFGQFSSLLVQALGPVPADFLESPAASLNHVYLIVHAVEGLAPGRYVYHRDRAALERLAAGDFRGEAGQLALGQDLAADASVNLYFLAPLGPILDRFGNRGYRAAQLEASISAGRVYLAAYAQRFGATGLTFYDDAVAHFFSPHAAGKSVMFLVAIGRKAKRPTAA